MVIKGILVQEVSLELREQMEELSTPTLPTLIMRQVEVLVRLTRQKLILECIKISMPLTAITRQLTDGQNGVVLTELKEYLEKEGFCL